MNMKRIVMLSSAMYSIGLAAARADEQIKAFDISMYTNERSRKGMPELPYTQTYQPKLNSKSKRW